MNGIVYRVINKINGKIYIGVTRRTLYTRKLEHIRLSKVSNPNYIFHKAIKKYGIENFIFEIIDYFIINKECIEKEKYYISEYNTFYKNNGYNMTLGGEGVLGHVYHHTDETKKQISLSMKGIKKTEETKRNMVEAQKKRNIWYKYRHSKEAKQKISNALKIRKRNPMSEETKNKLKLINIGKKLSYDTIEKIRLKNTGKKRTNECKELLSKLKIKVIPVDIYNIICNHLKCGITPYVISKRLKYENNYKIDRKTISNRIDEFI